MCDYKNKTCNFCEHSQINKIGLLNRYNIYCNYSKSMKMIDLSVPDKAYVEIPEWCQKKNKNMENTKLTFNDKMDILRKMSPFIKWNDIKENEIYHLPQLPGEERKDIFIVRKDSYSLTYKDVEGSSNISYTIYPSTLISKFLVKNKIKNYVIKSNNK